MNKLKTIISCLLLTTVPAVYADTTRGSEAKTGTTEYLPEKGDFSVGIDLVPLIRTIGGALNNEKTTPVGGTPMEYDNMNLRPSVSIMGKYMLTDKWALKANVGVLVKKIENRSYVADDQARVLDPLSEAEVVDCENVTRSGGSLMFGTEYHLGNHRVQGIFGCGVLFGFSTSSTSYTYGNAMTQFNQTPTTFMGNNASRVVSNRQNPNFAAGIYGSVGAAWYVAPKVALGGEVNLSLYGMFGAKSVRKTEQYNYAYETVETVTDITAPGNRGLVFGTDNLGASLYVMFYF